MAKGAYIGAPKPEYEPVFADNSWSQIIKACQKNEVPDTWAVGDQKDMTINGTDYAIDIIGKHHDTYADGSGTAPLTFQLHDFYGTTYAMNNTNTNVGGWTSCVMRTTHLPAILALMPTEVQAGIKEVNKLTSAGAQSGIINTTADKLFLLSENEVFGKVTYSVAGEGNQYEYYVEGNSAGRAEGTTYYPLWVRSPCDTNAEYFCAVSGASNPGSTIYAANSSRRIVPAFCFGGTSEINNTFGGYSVARKIKKCYVGIDGVARKIKKAYIGIGGVARPCWSGGELAYYGTATALSVARNNLAATSVGNYALFGGGSGGSYQSNVDAYDKTLTRTSPTILSYARGRFAATTVGDYALFGGGQYSGGYLSNVDAYNSSLSHTSTDLSYPRYFLSATSVGNYALFGGGYAGGTPQSIVDAYDTSLTRTVPTALSGARFELAAAAVGSYALFAGGLNSSGSAVTYIDVYDTSLTKTIQYTLTKRARLAATSVSGYALFGGGISSGVLATVEAYDESLTETVLTGLSVARQYLAATSVGNYALFGGGADASLSDLTTVDAYDASLTRTTPTELSTARGFLAATTIGDYALFGGGGNGTTSAVVDVYTV